MTSAPPTSVALDASLWDEPTTGIGLGTRCLARALEREGVRVVRVGARLSGEHPRGAMGRTAFFLGPLPALLRRLDAPLFHALCNFNLPLTRVPGKAYVLTVNDLIPELLPETVSVPFRWQFKLWLTRSLKVADQVICISEHTRRDLLARYPFVDPARVHAVHMGVDHVEIAAPDSTAESFLDTLALPPRFLLYAGSLDARKNLGLVLDACERLRAQGRPVTLVLAGQRWFGSGPVEKRVATLRAEGLDVRPTGYLEEKVFYALMRRASAFVFPSLYEGFGLPPLEAMRLGVPTIVSSAGALPEVCGDAAVQVSPDDADGLAAAVDRLLHSEGERRALAAAGQQRAARFTWQATARRTLEVYAEALQVAAFPG